MHHILSSFLFVWKWGQTRSFASDTLLPLYTVGSHPFFFSLLSRKLKPEWEEINGYCHWKFSRNCRHRFISRSYHLNEWRLSLVFVYTWTFIRVFCIFYKVEQMQAVSSFFTLPHLLCRLIISHISVVWSPVQIFAHVQLLQTHYVTEYMYMPQLNLETIHNFQNCLSWEK